MTISIATYGSYLHDLGYPGELVDLNACNVISMLNTAAVAVQFGYAVASDQSGIGAGAGATCKAPAVDADPIIGIAKRFPIRPASYQTDLVSYAQYDEVSVIKLGEVYVTAYENVTEGTGALSITAQNGAIGGVSNGAAGTGRVVIPNAFWMTTTTAGNVGIVRISN